MRTPALSLLIILIASPAFGMPSWGGSCSSCHTSRRPDNVEVAGDSLLNLDGLRNDGKIRGDLQTYTVNPGDTIILAATIADGSDNFSVQLKRLDIDGVIGDFGDTLAGYVADAEWVAQSSYYTDTSFGSPWVGPESFFYTLTIALDTPLNIYDLEFAVAGKGVDGLFYDDEHFLLNVVSGGPAIPEPTTFALAALALMGLAFLRR